MTHDRKFKVLTIITESALEGILVKELQELGARGYTITEARGKGSRGVRNANWDASSNIRIEIVCDEQTAMTLAEHVRENYYLNYAMTLFMYDVQVLRHDKF